MIKKGNVKMTCRERDTEQHLEQKIINFVKDFSFDDKMEIFSIICEMRAVEINKNQHQFTQSGWKILD